MSTPPVEDLFSVLSRTAIFWRDRQEFFQSHGYTLRPRYRPGWVASWIRDPTLKRNHTEDYLDWHVLRPHVLDARRLSDGKLVLLKRVSTDSQEVRIVKYLSSPDLRSDTTNHCVPILDILEDSQDPTISFLVMPFLRYIDDPDMDTVGSILDCVEQLLQGLSFLHKHHVAHRDCAYKNVMMDASAIFPKGFHPMADMCLPDDVVRFAPIIPRSCVEVKYYFVDFGISTLFSADDTNRLVTGTSGLDEDVPELSDSNPYDPFKVDVFILGNLFRQTFIEKYSNVDMLVPLVARMLERNPSSRPSAEEALHLFHGIRRNVCTIRRFWRAHPRDEPLVIQVIFDIISLFLLAYWHVVPPGVSTIESYRAVGRI